LALMFVFVLGKRTRLFLIFEASIVLH